MKIDDGMKNVLTGMGGARDKSTYSEFDYRMNCLTDEEITALYRQFWFAKAIDCKADDMTREWRTFDIKSLEPSQIEEIENYEKKISLQDKMNWATKLADAYGGSLVVMHFNGLGEISEELDWSKVTKDSLEKLTVVDRRDVTFTSNNVMQNPFNDRYGIPNYYQYSYAPDLKIHPSRTIKLIGRQVSNREFIENNYWGDSELERWSDTAKSVQTVMSGITHLLHQVNIDIYGLKGLTEILGTNGGDQKVRDYCEIIYQMMSIYGLMLKDSEDTFERKPVNFATLPDILDKFLDVLAGATEVPKTRLLNQSPTGLSGKGESELTNYYDGIRGRQYSKLAPALEVIDKALVISALGSMPEGYSYEWNSLEREDETEKANNDKTQVETLNILYGIGVPETALIKDAVERGLVKNMSEEEIASLEFEADNNPEPDNELDAQ
jgi:phage-related protein (TIGR01555 family)